MKNGHFMLAPFETMWGCIIFSVLHFLAYAFSVQASAKVCAENTVKLYEQ